MPDVPAATPAPAAPLPMLRPPRDPEAWHQVFAPGGYEWWHFVARSDDGRTQLLAALKDGDVFDPRYQHRYRSYVRRPTRRLPPLPRDFPAASLAVYCEGQSPAGFASAFAPGSFEGSVESPSVSIGPNTAHRDAGGACRLQLGGEGLQASLIFAPTAPPSDWMSSPSSAGPDHHALLLASCAVTGTLIIDGQSTTFTGRGCHEHRVGTSPISAGLDGWLRGWVLSREACIAFEAATPKEEALVVHLAGGSSTIQRPRGRLEWPPGARNVGPPAVVRLEGLVLEKPRVLESAPSLLRVLYQAGGGAAGAEALCELHYPPRQGRLLGKLLPG